MLQCLVLVYHNQESLQASNFVNLINHRNLQNLKLAYENFRDIQYITLMKYRLPQHLALITFCFVPIRKKPVSGARYSTPETRWIMLQFYMEVGVRESSWMTWEGMIYCSTFFHLASLLCLFLASQWTGRLLRL